MAAIQHVRRSSRALSAAAWLLIGLALIGLGRAIAVLLESDLLGFIGADLFFLVAMSIYTSGNAAPDREGR